MKEHYHCSICEKSYSTIKEAEKCFKNHNEIEHLRWIAKEVHYLKLETYELFKNMTFIEKKYKKYWIEGKYVK